MLEYDDSAFYYFSFTFLTLAIVPTAYYTAKDVLGFIKPAASECFEAVPGFV